MKRRNGKGQEGRVGERGRRGKGDGWNGPQFSDQKVTSLYVCVYVCSGRRGAVLAPSHYSLVLHLKCFLCVA